MRVLNNTLLSTLLVSLLALPASAQVYSPAENRLVVSQLTDPTLLKGVKYLICGLGYKKEWTLQVPPEGGEEVYVGEESEKLRQQLLSDILSTAKDPAYCIDEGGVIPAYFSEVEPEYEFIHYDYLTAGFKNILAAYKTHELDQFSALSLDETRNLKIALRDATSYLMEASLLIGNDDLIKGLRRFRRDNNDPRTNVEFLRGSEKAFLNVIQEVLDVFIFYPTALRSQGDRGESGLPISSTAVIIESYIDEEPNTLFNSGIVTNDYMNAINLVNRYALAASSEAKSLFYKNNVQDVDHLPFKNFPGPEDLDINGDGIKNKAGRDDAAREAKESGNSFYLQTLALTSQQSEDDCYVNNGYEMKRYLNDMARLYEDIQSGFNPLKLAGDFVPYQRVENFLSYAKSRIEAAKTSEARAESSLKSFQQTETATRDELRRQNEIYLDQLYQLTGIDPEHILGANGFELPQIQKELRQEFLEKAEESVVVNNDGSIGLLFFDLNEARLQLSLQQQQLENLHAQIEIEEERSGQVTNLVLENGEKLSALTYSTAMAQCCSRTVTANTGVSYEIGGSVTVSASLSVTEQINPNMRKIAKGQSAMALLQATQQAEIEGANSASLIKKLLLEQATIFVSIELAMNNIARQKARIEEQWKQVERTLNNYAKSREDFVLAYYNDPSYRLDALKDEIIADNDFSTALEATYYASKALEYMWSERFNNPILRLDGGLPEPLSPSYDSFQRSESIFSADFAGVKADDKSLDLFYSALNEWDLKMRQSRYPENQTARVRLSMRDDILGYGVYEPTQAERKFQGFIDERFQMGESDEKLDLLFDFTMGIGDESLFPAHPNMKIESISINLVSTAERSIRDSYRMDPALVDLVMLDRAYVRSFFSEYPATDDIITYQLQEGRTIDKSPFIATVEASIDGYASPLPVPNTQLANHSPAVSQWMLRIKGNRLNNKDLELRFLSDIELEIEYSYGKPRDIQWPR